MNQDQARQRKEQAETERHQAWVNHAMRRAEAKIDAYTRQGKACCTIELRFPPGKPDDVTSAAVATSLSEVMRAKGYEIRIRHQIHHDGAFCEIIWS